MPYNNNNSRTTTNMNEGGHMADYKNRGDVVLNPTKNPDYYYASIRTGSDDVKRDVELKRVSDTAFSGTMKPADPSEDMKVRAFKTAERTGNLEFPHLPEGVSVKWDEGKDKRKYVSFDLADPATGEVFFNIRPGQLVMFDRLNDVLSHEADIKAGKKKADSKAPAAFSGFAATYDGQVFVPSAWAKHASKDKDGNAIEPRLFFSGDCMAYDAHERSRAVAAKNAPPLTRGGKRVAKPADTEKTAEL